ncbi:hypothetical protein OEM_15350 [Mycobacterium intracellulare subsp. yongonense 05-1390]|nr:hypothetical protein OEM_15350 [Mycobacterium intracellulare subsp. yongonense 05-1390]
MGRPAAPGACAALAIGTRACLTSGLAVLTTDVGDGVAW